VISHITFNIEFLFREEKYLIIKVIGQELHHNCCSNVLFVVYLLPLIQPSDRANAIVQIIMLTPRRGTRFVTLLVTLVDC
jgi:hypothetical protein